MVDQVRSEATAISGAGRGACQAWEVERTSCTYQTPFTRPMPVRLKAGAPAIRIVPRDAPASRARGGTRGHERAPLGMRLFTDSCGHLSGFSA